LSDAKSETSDAQEDALTATGTGNDAPGSATTATSVPVMPRFLRPTALSCLTTPARHGRDDSDGQQEAMAEAPSSIGLWVVFVLAGVVCAVLAPLTTRRSTQSACS